MGRDRRLYLVFGTLLFVVLELLLVIAVYWWPAFRDNAGALKSIASPVPMLAKQVDLISLIGVPGYVVGQHYFKGCNTLGAAAAVLFAMGAVAGEVQRGTFEIWLARPVSRVRLFTERYLLGLMALFIPVLLSSLTTPWLLETLVDESMSYGHLALCSVHEGLFLGVLYSFTFLLSARGSQPLKIAFVMLFLSIFQFAIYMVQTITDYSAFRLADIETFAWILSKDTLDWPLVGGMALACGACYALGLKSFLARTP